MWRTGAGERIGDEEKGFAFVTHALSSGEGSPINFLVPRR